MPDVSGSVFPRSCHSSLLQVKRSIKIITEQKIMYVEPLAGRSILLRQQFPGSDSSLRDNLLLPRERIYRTKADSLAAVLAPTAELLDFP